ncbi:MAG: hypothetical protein CV087_17420 [Candidatus Brocadia sp. WS118]|nr:MAG: hypothetical protein CV087_17420 [Candidatus Brocadia sp. WS118]
MKLYDKIKLLLIQHPELRDSDKLLQWRIWAQQGHVMNGSLSFESFMNNHLISTETIRRTRQKVQENFPELRSSTRIQQFKDKKRRTKGSFVYKEPFKVVKYEGNICYIE